MRVHPFGRTVCSCVFVHFRKLQKFVQALYSTYVNLYFTYLEINPLGESAQVAWLFPDLKTHLVFEEERIFFHKASMFLKTQFFFCGI